MLRSNMSLVAGGVAAAATVIIGGWTLLNARSAQASISTATIVMPTGSPRAGRAEPPSPDANPAGETRNKPYLRLDGERSEFGFDGDQGSMHVNKDGMNVRTPLGKFEIKW
jgi:hypothetical protein